MIRSRFSLRVGWYLPSLAVLGMIWGLSLGPGLYDASPYAPYRLYFPPAQADMTSEFTISQPPAITVHPPADTGMVSTPQALTEADSLKLMAMYSVERTRVYSWNYQLFSALCHSKPERSIYLNGIQMPVNARCTGIFSGLWFSILLVPFVGHRFYRKKWVLSLLALMVIFQMLDVVGNSLGWWVNTVASRWLLGFPLGLFMILALTDLFVHPRSFDGMPE